MSNSISNSEMINKFARASHQGIKEYHRYIQDRVIPILQSMLNRSEYEESLISVYYRIQLLMRTLTKLDTFDDFQAVRSLGRSMFELLLDMKTLKFNNGLSVQFLSYPKIERMRTAIRVADFVADHPSPARKKRFRHQIALANDAGQIKDCEDILSKTFGITTDVSVDRARKFPLSWCKLTVRAQAETFGTDILEEYLADYSIASWFVHGGFAGLSGISQEGFVNAYGRGHLLAQRSCHEATFIIGTDLRLFDAQPNLWSEMKELEQIPARLAYDQPPDF